MVNSHFSLKSHAVSAFTRQWTLNHASQKAISRASAQSITRYICDVTFCNPVAFSFVFTMLLIQLASQYASDPE
jgi:hypothetical protein